MQRIMKICARGALGLGAAALLLSGVPAHAGPASGAASREAQPLLLTQTKAQPGDAAKQGQQPQPEEQPKKDQAQPQPQPQNQPKKAKMRGMAPEAAREAVPAAGQPGAKRFGAGVIRKSEKPVDEE